MPQIYNRKNIILAITGALCLSAIILIYFSYSAKKNLLTHPANTNNNANESFTTTQDQEKKINDVRDYITNILTAQSPVYAIPQDNISAVYGFNESNPDSPLKLDDLSNLSAEFQLNFIQQIQDAEINELQSRLSQLPITKTNIIPRPEKIKHLNTGKVYNLLKTPDQLGTQFGFITDPNNAVCLKHIPDTNGNTIDLTACDHNYNAAGQKFLLETVNNNNDFNDMLDPDRKPDIYKKYKVDPLFSYGTYPFSVIKRVCSN